MKRGDNYGLNKSGREASIFCGFRKNLRFILAVPTKYEVFCGIVSAHVVILNPVGLFTRRRLLLTKSSNEVSQQWESTKIRACLQPPKRRK
jgi:hypothetical protein